MLASVLEETSDELEDEALVEVDLVVVPDFVIDEVVWDDCVDFF